MALTEDEARGTRKSRISTRIWSIFLGVSVLVIAVAVLIGTPTQLAPDHIDVIMIWALCVGGAAGIGMFVLVATGTLEVRGNNRVLGGIAMWLAGSVIGLLATMLIATRIFQFIDFPAATTVQYERDFPIERAYLGSKHRYHIQLEEYFADMDISEADYRRFGDNRDNIHPQGFCLHALTQQSGDAIRIMQDDARTFKDGSVIPCPGGPQVRATPAPPRH